MERKVTDQTLATQGVRGDRPAMPEQSAHGSHASRGWPLVVLVLSGLTLLGWSYLGLMVADMVPAMDMTEAGPGMGLFNLFNLYRGLPADARAALAALCLPNAAATFGMPAEHWQILDAAKVFVMWFMMALAMMIPTAVPMLKAFHKRQAGRVTSAFRLNVITLAVAFGYLLVWSGYAVVATGAQWLLVTLETLSPMMAPVSLAFTASVLVAAGLYQFTPAKLSCLSRCWYPTFNFAGPGGVLAAVREGLWQGALCLGCCWAVMAVMFAVGLMNVLWIAILGVVMAVEKTLPSNWLYKIVGVIFISWGGFLAIVVYAGVAA